MAAAAVAPHFEEGGQRGLCPIYVVRARSLFAVSSTRRGRSQETLAVYSSGSHGHGVERRLVIFVAADADLGSRLHLPGEDRRDDEMGIDRIREETEEMQFR